ncbi:MAG: ArsA family ATPase [Acidimicrobiia bacterium]|nr:ArsA family ATPase [Acidimicrobiia bacterium]
MTGITLVMGSGGVGKTTVAAGTAALIAQSGLRTLAITVDPARRLADAMGIGQASDPTRVAGFAHLDVAMLDAAAAWDDIARRHADAATARRLVTNPYFRAVADRFPSGQNYAAGETLLHHAESGSYDHIVVDTPPAEGGSAFLAAPRRIRTLVAGRALRVLTGPRLPGRRLVYSVTARPALKVADAVLGGRLLEDVAEFLLDLSAIYPGLARRSRAVEALYAGAGLVVVVTPDPGPIAEARRILSHPSGATRAPRAVVFNRVVPHAWTKAPPAPPDPVGANLSRWAAEAARHEALRHSFSSHTGVTPIPLPWLVEPPASPLALADLMRSAGFDPGLS